MREKAALYLRSSKDRHDVSIDAQRDELRRLAKTRTIEVVREFVDVVESAKDEHRPAFQALRAGFKDPARNWTVVMLLEPSRLSRNQYVAHVFTHDARQCGVSVVYARMPESNPMVDILITPLMHGFAEYHSWESKQKGLAGMAENVKRGFRAGGRAPYGYRLKRETTGPVRDGKLVMKSKLEPDDIAPVVAAYLKARAAGLPRRTAKHQSGINLPDTTLIGMEWNALLYAGSTVWNVHSERVRGRAIGGTKRRPRSEWVIKDGTHPALIERDEAEALLRQLEDKAKNRRDRAPQDYLLSGLVHTPSGVPWHGCRDRDSRSYRHGRGRRISAVALEKRVIATVREGLQSPDIVRALLDEARSMAAPEAMVRKISRAHARIEQLDKRIAGTVALLHETSTPRPLFVQIEAWEKERDSVRASIVEDEIRLARIRVRHPSPKGTSRRC